MEFLEAQEEDLMRRANNDDRTAMALLVSTDMRNQFNAIAEDSKSPEEYIQRTRPLRQQVIGERSAYEDVFDGWRESDIPAERDSALIYDIDRKATNSETKEVDWELHDQLEASLMAEIGEDRWLAAQENIGMIDPRWNEFEINRREISSDLDVTGFYQLRDEAWNRVNERPAANKLGLSDYNTFYEWRNARVEEVIVELDDVYSEQARERIGPTQLRNIAKKRVEKEAPSVWFNSDLEPLQKKWEAQNPELLERAIEYDFIGWNDFRRAVVNRARAQGNEQ